MKNIVIGSRGSKLALYQSNLVKQLLEEAFPDVTCEVRIIHTKGDKILDVALSKIGDKGLFTKELERALLAGEVDLCVHSSKDMPTKLPEGLAIMGMPRRANPQDVIIAADKTMTLDSLPQGARVATGSLRRVAQLLKARPDVEVCEIRGNVDSRVKRILSGEFDAGILAAAGVERLELNDAIASYIPTDQLIPAVGQGAIAIEARADDQEIAGFLQAITDNDTLHAVAAERMVLAAFEGGCQVPMGVHATVEGASMSMVGFVASLDGAQLVKAHAEGEAEHYALVADQLIASLRELGAEEILATVLQAAQTPAEASESRSKAPFQPPATVYLTGAGSGDPGLLTLRAKELLETADEVIYDYLASDAVVRFAAPSAKKIFVGKKGFSQHVTQDEINQCLIDEALAHPGARIVRLKGGDPFVFGRGGEEALALGERGIPFEVVPGVTAGVAACAYAGIPVTHRGLASAVTLITGHETPDKPESAINWESFATNAGTLCFYMGVRDLPHIVERLVHFGRPLSTPVALVRWGTTPEQETLTGTLADIVKKVEEAQFKAPAIIVVGDVVNLRDRLQWFENRPLFGKTIAVTRSREQASAVVQQLGDLGAKVVEFPTIQTIPRDNDEVRAAADSLASYDWVVFTSANGVTSFFDALKAQGRDARAFGSARVCAIGPATAEALMQRGIVADALPERFVAESVAQTLIERGVGEGSSVLLLRAAVARDTLIDMLRAKGARVDVVAVYDTVMPQADEQAGQVLQLLRDGALDAVTFTSSSTVRNFCSLVRKALGAQAADGAQAASEGLAALMADVACLSIGPVTTSTLAKEGLAATVEAQSYTVPGLVQATVEYFGGANAS